MSVHTIPLETSVVKLEASQAFEALTHQEKSYALGLARADWAGAKICLLQCSAESTPIFALLQLVFSAQSIAELLAAAAAAGLNQEEIDQAMMYAAAFYGNLGNYKSFGDTKFVPMLPPDRFQLLMLASRADAAAVKALWEECHERMYSLPPRQRQLGLGAAAGVSTYFSANCEESDADIGNRFLDSLGLSAYNTRLFKGDDGSYTVRIASATVSSQGGDPVAQLCREHSFEGHPFVVQRGDYAPLMARIVAGIREAEAHASNEEQLAMLKCYAESFELGSIDEHKNGSRHWIKDSGPAVESYIGFIESYRDPSGVRGEWEGFVACVNKEVSKKFGMLVDGAEDLLKLFPWPPEFEKDVFLRPDFTSLEVLAFGSSGVPAGINIPNYDDIRQNEGFKNVSLGNVLAASYGAGDKPIPFIREHDQPMFKALKGEAFEVQVGCHELLGHGSGKLFHQDTDDAAKLLQAGFIHPLTSEAATGPFYAPGSTWDSTFGKIASTFEECRAECCGIYLSLEPDVLRVFGHASQADAPGGIHDISYINWLLMAHAGLRALEFYTPSTGGWRQAHMQARYVILRVLLEAGQGLVTLTPQPGSDGEPDMVVELNRALVATVGKEAIAAFLLKLQTYKTLGDVTAGAAMYRSYSEVPAEMIAIRNVVMARKEPRKLLVQPHLYRDGEAINMANFEESPSGMVASFVARFPAEDSELLDLYHAEKVAVSD